MNRKRLSCGFLAAALLFGSIAWPAPAVKAAEPDLQQGLTAYYSFDDESLANSAGEKKEAAAVVKGLKEYTGVLTWKSGKSGKALQLGDYGLQLNQRNLGDKFTVSMWLKPDGTLNENQSVLFLGYHDPETWFGVAGNKANSPECKIWARGGGYNSHTTLGEVNISSNEWHCLTLTGTENTLTAYLDGEQVASGDTNHPLSGENQDIYVGVTNWDPAFTGLVDEIRVYGRTLTEGELYQLYDNRAPEVILEEKGITVTSVLKMPVKRNESIQVQMPAVVREYGAVISYESSDSTVASVDSSGKVKALKEGTADITISVALNGVTNTAVTKVTVAGTIADSLAAYYKFDGNLNNEKGSAATALQKGLGAYSGAVQYEAGRDGQAVFLKGYGLKLNQADLGEEYTVSLWLKPAQDLAENQSVLFLGYHAPECWTAVSGDTAGVYKVWANGGIYKTHTTLFSPDVTAKEWHQLTLTGAAGIVNVWLDGICLGTAQSNDPLKGANQDIYLGVNNWDTEFEGLIDEVQIYSIALNEEEIQSQAPDEFCGMLQKKMEDRIPAEVVLGRNESVDEIKYDLTLPSEMGGLPVVWKSSNPAVVKEDGTISSPSAATEVTLTATITSGRINASVTYRLKVAPLDRSALDKLIQKAESIDTTNLVNASRERLEKAIEEAKAADSFSKIAAAYERLAMASSKRCYMEDFLNPFRSVVSPAVQTAVKESGSEKLFAIPGNIEDAVDVRYVSEKPDIVSYADGMITGLKPGKAVVTAVVTSRYDQWVMEYSTAVNVEEKGNDSEPDDPNDPSGPSNPNDPSDPTDPNDPSNPWNPSNGDDGGSSGGKRTESHDSGNVASQVEPAKDANTNDSTDLVLPVTGLLVGTVLITGYCLRKRKNKP